MEEKEMIRCYQCKHFKPYKKSTSRGRCLDANIKVYAVDYCDDAVKKE